MIHSEFLHSFFGHPLMALAHLIGARGIGDWFHDVAFPIPPQPASEGRCPNCPRNIKSEAPAHAQ